MDQNAKADHYFPDLAAEISAAEGIRQGLDDAANGHTRPARKVFQELRAKHGISHVTPSTDG